MRATNPRVKSQAKRLRQQFEGVVWRFRTGGQWREMPREFGAWSMVHNRFRQWRDAGVFKVLLEGLIAESVKRGEVDLSLVSVDSTTVRAHHDAEPRRRRSYRNSEPHHGKQHVASLRALRVFRLDQAG
ncbi:hypothetical protein TNCT1_69970 [Streptomyces sp. 1-11]|nr:hypothetical protein TNCT1_69970 [Streptomyces sp. 1-11]